jgi:hypothetical protein
MSSGVAGGATQGTPRIAYLATGSEAIRVQALYSALTALAWRGALPLGLHVYTDAPERFRELGPAAEIVPVDRARERRWRGPWGFLYRMKPMVLAELSARFPADRIAFVDADTYWIGDVARVFERIGPRSAVMHQREYFVGTLGTQQIRNFRRRMGRSTFRGAPIDVDAWMWNSGVVGLHPDHAPILSDWIDYVDEVHPRNRKPIVEQYAISWLLQRRLERLSPCDDVVAHYWADKDRHVAAIRATVERLRTLPPEEQDAFLRGEPLRIRGAPPVRRRDGFLRRMRTSLLERMPLRYRACD